MATVIGTCTLSFDSGGAVSIGGSGVAKRYMNALQPVRLPGSTILFLRSKGATASETALIQNLVDECTALATAYHDALTIDAVVSGAAVT